jgi:DNA modification methylase
LGIKSEVGRDVNCLPKGFDEEKYGIKQAQSTSIFDPVLCEIAYKWFSKENDKIIDPFAGGSVRGLIAGMLKRNYTGIDLSEKQIEANKQQYEEINNKYSGIIKPNWINGDSLNCKELANDKYNLLFTCPPYYDLEVYSNKDNDLSNMCTYEEFIKTYSKIINNACSMLEDNSFAVIVVGNMRNHKDGSYYDFVGDTVRAFQNAGLMYYNEMILVNVIGTLPVRAPKQFNASRKVGKQHQQVLVFYKGNPDKIKEKFGSFEE